MSENINVCEYIESKCVHVEADCFDTPLIIPSQISEIRIFEQLISVRKVFILLLKKSSKITDVIKSEVKFPTKLTDM